MDVRSVLLQKIQKRISRAREALARFDDTTAERMLVSDDWNVRDLVAHLAHWTGEAARRIPEVASGDESKSYDIERINAEVYRKNKRMSFVMLLPQLRRAEEALLEAIRSAPPEQLVGENGVREWVDTCIAHYDHNWPGLSEDVDRLSQLSPDHS